MALTHPRPILLSTQPFTTNSFLVRWVCIIHLTKCRSINKQTLSYHEPDSVDSLRCKMTGGACFCSRKMQQICFFLTKSVQTGSGAHAAPYSVGPGDLSPRVKRSLHPEPRLRMSGRTPLLPPYAVMRCIVTT